MKKYPTLVLRLCTHRLNKFQVAMGQTDLIRQAVKCLAREDAQEQEEAVALLYELSKSYAFCEKIGATSGAILFLVGLTSNESGHIKTAELADKILKNLEKCDNNVMQMAENGRLQPLLDRLIAGDASIHKTVFRTYLDNVVSFLGSSKQSKIRLLPLRINHSHEK